MIMNIFLVFAILVLFSVIGIGPYRLLCPSQWKETPFSFILLIAYGITTTLILNCIFLSYDFLFNRSFSFSVAICLFLGAVSFVVMPRNKHIEQKAITEKLQLSLFVSLASLLPLLILSSNSALNLRLGVDVALYTETADALLKNKSFHDLHGFVADCFFLHFRWGEPIFLSFVQKSLGFGAPVLNHAYLINASLYGFLGAMSAFLLYSCAKINLKWSLLGSLLILSNVNMLFILTEGQWPHFFALPFLILFTICWYHLREGLLEKGAVKLTITMCLMFTTILITINETVPLLIALSLFLAFLDVVTKNFKRLYKTQYIFFGVTALSLLMVNKFSFFEFTQHGNLISHIFNLSIKAAGYPLPHFSWPFEILGHSNIYYAWKSWFAEQGLPFHLVARKLPELIFVFSGSIVVSVICMLGLLKIEKEKRIFWLPFIAMPSVAYFFYMYYQPELLSI